MHKNLQNNNLYIFEYIYVISNQKFQTISILFIVFIYFVYPFLSF